MCDVLLGSKSTEMKELDELPEVTKNIKKIYFKQILRFFSSFSMKFEKKGFL
jgi:hypothetical protein